MASKNIFSKIKTVFTKNADEKSPKKEKSSPKKVPAADPPKKKITFGDILSDELRQLRRRGLSRKYQPYTREEILQDCFESEKLFQLFKAIDEVSTQSQDDLLGRNLSIYFKDSYKTISKQFYQHCYKGDKTDIGSIEVLSLTGSSSESPQKRVSPLVCAAIYGLYDQEEPVLERIYPDLETETGLSVELKKWIEKNLATAALPDAVYNKPEDYLYFLVDINKRKFEALDRKSFEKLSETKGQDNALLYGVSFFKQLPVTASMKERYINLNRPQVPRAVCVLSKVPMFGHIVNHCEPLLKDILSKENSEEFEALKELYTKADPVLKDITVDSHELQANINVKKLVAFLRDKTTTIWKALFLERRVLVYSENPSACSTFIHTLLSLFPCACHFKYSSRALTSIENHYSEYGLPLQICHDKCPLLPNFGMHQVEEIAAAKGFIGGASNFLIRTLSKVGWDILVDLDNNKIQFKDDAVKKSLTPSKLEKELINSILKKLDKKAPKDIVAWSKLDNSLFVDKEDEDEFEGTEEWIRQKFYEHLKDLLTELEFFRYYSSEYKLEPVIQGYNSYIAKKGEETQGKGSIIRLSTKSDSDSDRKSEERLDSASPSPFRGSEQQFFPTDEKKEETENAEEVKEEPQNQKSLDELQATIDKQANVEETKESKDSLAEAQEENLHPDDPRVALKNELTPVKNSMKILRDYGADWLLEWIKTDNFRYWARNPRELIRDRSVNNSTAKDHFWCYENGDLYLGGLANGEKHGNGQYLYRHSRLVYRGGWVNGKKSGAGKLCSLEGTDLVFEGNFKNDKKDGFGKLIQGRESYTGTFANDRYEGSGALTDSDGNVYEGDFKDGYKWGMGKLKLASGETYLGELLKDTYHGQGQYIYSSGDVYSGAFNMGRRTGFGILQSASGDIHEGQFIEDEFCGRGTLKRNDGYKFEGEFNKGVLVNGKQGVIYYPDGSKFEGLISDYKANGEGKLVKKDEKGAEVATKGRFENGELVEEFKEEAQKKAPAQEENKEEPKAVAENKEQEPVKEEEVKEVEEKALTSEKEKGEGVEKGSEEQAQNEEK